MRFTKMHGAGNDFVIIDMTKEDIRTEDIPELAERLCARRTGIGADGLMLVDRATYGGDFKLRFYNADGTMGEMCGNGARCIARYGYEHGLAGETQRIETTAGLVIGERMSRTMYRVRLNDPSVLDLHRCACGCGCAYTELGDPGIPHAVLLLPEWDEMPAEELRGLGRKLRYAPEFPKGANVSFVKLTGEDAIKAVTYERGVEDFTLACGTGSGSIVMTMMLRGLVSGKNVRVSMPGGELFISCDPDGKNIFLTGPTCVAFEGETKEII